MLLELACLIGCVFFIWIFVHKPQKLEPIVSYPIRRVLSIDEQKKRADRRRIVGALSRPLDELKLTLTIYGQVETNSIRFSQQLVAYARDCQIVCSCTTFSYGRSKCFRITYIRMFENAISPYLYPVLANIVLDYLK